MSFNINLLCSIWCLNFKRLLTLCSASYFYTSGESFQDNVSIS